ncbi:MAG: class I SAM-dependent methyltransferase [Anaerolineae bacterium]|jgi:SAM-dependent methyltransferase
MSRIDPVEYNRRAWDRQVEGGNRWTVPVGPEATAAAREGRWQIFLTPTRAVPRAWFPEMEGCRVLCLASGGGQQGPILAAAGACVTVFDNSPRQLARDRQVAERDGLEITTVRGDMADLSAFSGGSFDLIVHPVSNVFVPAVRPVWREAYRVLRPAGGLLAGFNNPAIYIFDWPLLEQGTFEVRHPLPYSDLESLSQAEQQRYIQKGWPFEWSHTLEDQIGGQIEAGFLLAGFYEDVNPPDEVDPLGKYMPPYIATRALKPSS